MSEPQRADLPTWECYDLVGGCSVGRLCFIDKATPIAYPVSFRMHHDEAGPQIVICTHAGSLMAGHTGPASFEVDEIDVEARVAWSVLLRGTLRRIHEPRDLPMPEPWTGAGQQVWLVLDVSSVSGRRFVAKPSSDEYAVDWELYMPDR